MDRIAEIIARMRANPGDIRFSEAKRVCDHFFGQPRQNGTSHCVYRMPWPGDPRVNIQRGESGKAKPYQVRQIIRAIDRLEGENAS
jgi:hypothetical protein